MIIMTTYALDEVPLKTVYLHGLVRTREGKNEQMIRNPALILDMIQKYGADALRLSMSLATLGKRRKTYEENRRYRIS